MNLAELRQQIDALDEQIILLLNQRADLVHAVGLIKKAEGSSIYVPEREEQVMRGLILKARQLQSRLPEEAIRAIYREIMSVSLALEKDLTIAFLGPEASDTDHAARRRFGASVRYAALPTLAEVFDAVARHKADYGVVPMENPEPGAAQHTLELFMESELRICAQIMTRAEIHLASQSPRAELRKIYAHPHAFNLCRGWLLRNLPEAELVEVASTPGAAERAAREPHSGALLNRVAAEAHDLPVREATIQDDAHATARFLVIGDAVAQPTGDDRTSLMFGLRDEPGALSEAIEPFKRLGINLHEIGNHAAKPKGWQHFFFVDIDGHATDPKIAEAISEVAQRCGLVKVLGTYPKSGPV